MTLKEDAEVREREREEMERVMVMRSAKEKENRKETDRARIEAVETARMLAVEKVRN